MRFFDPYNRVLSFWESRRNPKSSFQECECHPHTPSKWGCDNQRWVDGVDVGVVGFFFCVCFELDILALTIEWSSWDTCPAIIVSKPPRPNLSQTLIVERFVMHVGGEVRGSTWMKWVGFGALAVSTMPCVGTRKGLCDYGGRWTFSLLWLPLLFSRVALSILSKSRRHVDSPRTAKTVDILFPWSGFFRGGLFGEGMHVSDQIS